MNDDMLHMEYLEGIAAQDVILLREKEKSYQGSWKKRGGVGTFMMLARKWDRLEAMAKANHYDIFEALFKHYLVKNAGEDGTALAEIRDLRCYLLLVEAEYQSRFVRKQAAPRHIGTPEDGGHHAKEELS